MRFVLGFCALLAACGGPAQPTTLDDLRAPGWRLAEAQVNKVSAAMYRWDMAGRAGCPTVRDLRSLSPSLPERDPWGHAIQTRCDLRGFVAVSVGPDGQLGTRDDAVSPLVVSHRSPNDVDVASGGLLDVNSRVVRGLPGF